MFRRLKDFFLDLLFPRQCIGCKKTDTWLCQNCFQLIKTNYQQVCYICRKESPFGKTCPQHLKKPRILDGLLVAAHYSGNPLLKKTIHTMKYQHHAEDIAEKLGKLLTKTFLSDSQNIFTLIPIPLHKTRLKERGFNQSQLLCREIKKKLPLTTNYSLLTRTIYTPPQAHTKSRQERHNNLKNAFSLQNKVDSQKTYLLVDDIVTTGTTLEECCQLLKNNGAQQVWGLVLARN